MFRFCIFTTAVSLAIAGAPLASAQQPAVDLRKPSAFDPPTPYGTPPIPTGSAQRESADSGRLPVRVVPSFQQRLAAAEAQHRAGLEAARPTVAHRSAWPGYHRTRWVIYYIPPIVD